jgi:hypothetical protein
MEVCRFISLRVLVPGSAGLKCMLQCVVTYGSLRKYSYHLFRIFSDPKGRSYAEPPSLFRMIRPFARIPADFSS